MKMKLLGAVLLSICFALLGLASGGIPVLSADTVPAGLSLTASPEPTATAAPVPSPEPSPAAQPSPSPTAEPAPISSPPPASPEPTPEDPWVPDVQVVPTTITWEDPIKNETSYEVDGRALMDQPPPISLPEDGPQILIIHTHGTEAYTPDGADQYESGEGWRTDDPAHTVVRVGQALAEALQAQGLRVLHDENLYDLPSYNGSYANSEAAIRRHLAEHPDIAMVIDLHRDALGDDETVYKTVVSRSDPSVAQIMLVVGTDVNLLARLISAEARGEPYSGQVAVGAVVLNRMEHPSFPSTMSGVIYQRGAFSCLDDGQFDKPVAESAYRAARDALNGWDPSGGAIYYFNPATATSQWIWSRPYLLTIGKHRFCK